MNLRLLLGLLMDANDSTLTSPGVEASGFQNSFSGLYSVFGTSSTGISTRSLSPPPARSVNHSATEDSGIRVSSRCQSTIQLRSLTSLILKPTTRRSSRFIAGFCTVICDYFIRPFSVNMVLVGQICPCV